MIVLPKNEFFVFYGYLFADSLWRELLIFFLHGPEHRAAMLEELFYLSNDFDAPIPKRIRMMYFFWVIPQIWKPAYSESWVC